jgi:hypothetical protein
MGDEFLISTVLHELVRNCPKSLTLMIPESFEILGQSRLSGCQGLSSIVIESDSHLSRIDSEAFCFSTVQSIVIPRTVEFIDVSAFAHGSISLMSAEHGNAIRQIRNQFLIDYNSHKLMHDFSRPWIADVPSEIEILGPSCYGGCNSIAELFGCPGPRLERPQSQAFSLSALQSIVIPRTIEYINGSAFVDVVLVGIFIEFGNPVVALPESLLTDGG